MAVLVTGGAGFIGTALTRKLTYTGYEVVIADNLSNSCKPKIDKNTSFVKADICSPSFENVFINNNIEYVFHLAAQSGIHLTESNPIENTRVNVLGSVNLFSLCKKYNVKKTIVFSSAAVYGIADYLPIDENHPCRPISYYGISKYTMELYLKQFDINYVILRPSNVYGKNQRMSESAGIITKFSHFMQNNELLTIYGDGNQVRDYLYVEDIANACVKLLGCDINTVTLNIASGKTLTVNEILELLSGYYDYNLKPIFSPANDFEVRENILDISKIKQMLKFSPDTEIHIG